MMNSERHGIYKHGIYTRIFQGRNGVRKAPEGTSTVQFLVDRNGHASIVGTVLTITKTGDTLLSLPSLHVDEQGNLYLF